MEFFSDFAKENQTIRNNAMYQKKTDDKLMLEQNCIQTEELLLTIINKQTMDNKDVLSIAETLKDDYKKEKLALDVKITHKGVNVVESFFEGFHKSNHNKLDIPHEFREFGMFSDYNLGPEETSLKDEYVKAVAKLAELEFRVCDVKVINLHDKVIVEFFCTKNQYTFAVSFLNSFRESVLFVNQVYDTITKQYIDTYTVLLNIKSTTYDWFLALVNNKNMDEHFKETVGFLIELPEKLSNVMNCTVAYRGEQYTVDNYFLIDMVPIDIESQNITLWVSPENICISQFFSNLDEMLHDKSLCKFFVERKNYNVDYIVQAINLYNNYESNNYGYVDKVSGVLGNHYSVINLLNHLGVENRIVNYTSVDGPEFDILMQFYKEGSYSGSICMEINSDYFPIDLYYVRLKYDKNVDPDNCKLDVVCMVTNVVSENNDRIEHGSYSVSGTFDECLKIVEEFIVKMDMPKRPIFNLVY